MSKRGFVCPTCGFELWLPLARLTVSSLGLYDDARFPGRCILALHEHFDDLTDVDAKTLVAFARDSQRAARAIKEATSADRMNYAILGNVHPHVHAHLIPRVRQGDPIATRPPWEHPSGVSPLRPRELARLTREIRSRLN